MPEPSLFVVSKGSSIDRRTNNISLYSILEDISAASFPMLIQEMEVTAAFRKSESDVESSSVLFRIFNNDTQLHEQPFEINFKGRNRHRTSLTLGGLVVPAPGSLRFVLLNEEDSSILEYVISVTKSDDLDVKVDDGSDSS